MKVLSLAGISAAAYGLMNSAVLASDCITAPFKPECQTSVPEISAMEGTAALVALAAVVLLVWERRRRAA
ncbi:hypothetical protein [Tropicimonas sp.]|uniref:hypothetical protein n=1 Tax=Tropicimonas sp. TaxID=2067044 RepID=UPI003A8B2168